METPSSNDEHKYTNCDTSLTGEHKNKLRGKNCTKRNLGEEEQVFHSITSQRVTEFAESIAEHLHVVIGLSSFLTKPKIPTK